MSLEEVVTGKPTETAQGEVVTGQVEKESEETTKRAWEAFQALSQSNIAEDAAMPKAGKKKAPVVEEAADEPEAEEEEPTDDSDVEESDEEPEEPEEDEDSSAVDVDAAATELSRAGLRMSVIKKMSKAEILAHTGTVGRLARENDDLRRQVAEAKRTEPAKSDAPKEPIGLPFDIKKAAQPVAKLLGVDEAEATPVLEQFARAITEPLMQQVAALQGVAVESFVSSARRELRERFPLLASDRKFKEVRSVMEGLTAPANVSRYAKHDALPDKIHAMMIDAAHVVFAESDAGKKKDAAVSRARKNGAPLAPTRQVKNQPTPPEGRAEEAWKLLRAGIKPKEARRKLDAG